MAGKSHGGVEYERGTAGVILSPRRRISRDSIRPDYVRGAEVAIKKALADAKKNVRGFKPEQVVGIGVDTTGSTPLPVDQNGQPLAFNKKFSKNPAAMAWCGKTTRALPRPPKSPRWQEAAPTISRQMCGIYSSEWFFSKNSALPANHTEVFDAASSWVELADYVPAALTGTESPDKLTVGVCAAGHKAMFNKNWGGYPDAEFLLQLDPKTR